MAKYCTHARLYWLLDQHGGGDSNFFDESYVNWPRMRAGFELMMKRFPASKRNQAYLVSYACRAGDGATYYKWRQTVHSGFFAQAAPTGISLEVCDARFRQKI